MSEPLVQVAGLAVDRGGRRVLEGVSFEAAPGDLIAVVGPNGAGKSTLFSALLGLLPAAAGEIIVRGGAASVPQHVPGRSSFPVTALDVAMMGAIKRIGPFGRGARRERRTAEAALERVALRRAEIARPFSELSGGQRQRALIARALVEGGSVLLLDEPLSGVDAPSEAAIMAVLAAIRAEGAAVLMATHDLHLARDHADKALLVNRRQFAFGPPAEALGAEELRGAYGARLIRVEHLDHVDAMDEGGHCDHDHGHGHGHDHEHDAGSA